MRDSKCPILIDGAVSEKKRLLWRKGAKDLPISRGSVLIIQHACQPGRHSPSPSPIPYRQTPYSATCEIMMPTAGKQPAKSFTRSRIYIPLHSASPTPRQRRTWSSSAHQHKLSRCRNCPSAPPSSRQPAPQSAAPDPVYSLAPSASCARCRWQARIAIAGQFQVQFQFQF